MHSNVHANKYMLICNADIFCYVLLCHRTSKCKREIITQRIISLPHIQNWLHDLFVYLSLCLVHMFTSGSEVAQLNPTQLQTSDIWQFLFMTTSLPTYVLLLYFFFSSSLHLNAINYKENLISDHKKRLKLNLHWLCCQLNTVSSPIWPILNEFNFFISIN